MSRFERRCPTRCIKEFRSPKTRKNQFQGSTSVRGSNTTPLAFTNESGVVFVVQGMNKTFTPDLDPDTLSRLAAYAERFRDLFHRPRQAAWCGVYLRGLIT